MAYEKFTKTIVEYSGESFTQSIQKDSSQTWADTEVGEYVLYDVNGDIVTQGNLTKSPDKLVMTVKIGYNVTSNLEGKYLLLVYLKDTADPDYRDVIAEYSITYKKPKA